MGGYHSDRHPDAGDMGVLTDYDSHLGVRHTELESVVTVLVQALADLDVATWEGEAGEAWRTSLDAPRTRLDAVRARLSAVRPALSTYVGAVEDLARRAEPERARLDEAEATMSSLYWNTQYTGGRYAPDEDARDRIREEIREDAEREQAQAWAALRDLHDERRTLDGVLCDALREGEPAGWDDLHHALVRAGVASVDDLTPGEISTAMADLAARVAAGDGDEQDVRDLQTFFETWGDDHGVMARTFLRIGGTGTTELIDRLGYQTLTGDLDPALALAAAQAVRLGLSNGSARWTPATASEFAREMLDGHASGSSIGFLFGDPDGARLGETLTVAMATMVDRIERDPMNPGHGASYDTSPNAGGRLLAILEDEDAFRRVDDFAGRVLQTLGQYPDAALAWLTAAGEDPYGDGELGADRVDYWFGERDWAANTTGDGFEGPSALWAGAQQATGSLLDPRAADPDVQRSVADLSSRVFELLSGNEQLVPDHMTPAGSLALATALAQQLPQLAEYPMSANTDRDGALHTGMLGGPDVWIVNAEQDWVADLMGVAGHDPGGHAVLAATVSEYQESVVAYAADPATSLSGEGAIARLLGTQAALEGAPVGAGLATGAAHDQQVRDALDDVSSLVGLVPVGGGTLAGYAVGEVAGWMADALGDAWATEYNDALAAEHGDEDARNDVMRERLTAIVDAYVEHGVMDAPEDEGRYVDELIQEYNDGFDAWAREAERGE
ncbi:hypothetical protein ACH436_17515 [Isoptericola sp. NPDC019693]|uniref:hypothetical protein n=1 Tax=Isoptericola sp. NPDC019693 TaxID=3364009 RepID=UPI00379CE7CD